MKRTLKIKSEKRSTKKKQRKFPMSGKSIFTYVPRAHISASWHKKFDKKLISDIL